MIVLLIELSGSHHPIPWPLSNGEAKKLALVGVTGGGSVSRTVHACSRRQRNRSDAIRVAHALSYALVCCEVPEPCCSVLRRGRDKAPIGRYLHLNLNRDATETVWMG
jgi:hypothetical protein